MNVRICIPIAAEKVSKTIPLIKKAESVGADLIEIRLDYIKDYRGIKKIAKSTSLPLIATNRQYEQGGHRLQDEDRRIQALIEAANLGFSYVDVELTTPSLDFLISELRELGVHPIVSFHNFEKTPDMLAMEKMMRSEIESGAEICKLVTTANEIVDNIRCLLLSSKFGEKNKVVCFAMGEKGILSRALSPLFGAYFTYASLRKGLETAPGQLSISDLKEIYGSFGVENWRFPGKLMSVQS